jgi:hypothetical protein
MAKVKIEFDKRAREQLLKSNDMFEELKKTADKVQQEATSTASSAEKGAGGKIDGYASAGFKVKKHIGGSRVEAHVESLADPETFKRAFFYTAKRDGVAHLRRALYKFTNRGA